VNRLARTLRRYKEKRIKSEDELVKIMEKVKLDKTILIKEKIDSIWGSMEGSDYKEVKHEIDKCKQRRLETVTKQKEAYQ
jgi:muramidase (phage lysozyme)